MATMDYTTPTLPLCTSLKERIRERNDPDKRFITALYGRSEGGTYVQLPHSIVMQYVQMVIEARFNAGAPLLNDPTLLQNFVQAAERHATGSNHL